MHHTAAFAESVLDGTGTTAALVAAVSDEVLFTSGDDMRVTAALNRLIGVQAFGARTTIFRVEAPSLRAFLNLAMSNIRLGEAPLDAADTFLPLFGNPLPLVSPESLNVTGDGGGDGATPEDVGALVMLADAAPQPVTGDIRTVRATTAINGTQRSWISGTITFQETLPAGRYQIVGGRMVDAAAMAFRFVLPGQGPRPGGFGSPDHEDRIPVGQRRGGWGVWGEFESESPPTVEVLSIGGTVASPSLWMDVIRVG